MATTSLELLIRVPVQTRGVPAERLGSTPKYVLDTRKPHSDLSDPLCRLRRIADRRIVPYNNIAHICCTQGMKVDVCVATTVRAMRPLAAHSVMYTCGEYAHRAAGNASFVLTHSATLNARVILYNIAYI